MHEARVPKDRQLSLFPQEFGPFIHLYSVELQQNIKVKKKKKPLKQRGVPEFTK